MNAQAQLALDALGNPIRRQILTMLVTDALSVGQIAEQLPVSRPAVSRHLRVLKEAGLVESDSKGTRNVFRLEAQGFEQARGWLDGFWDEALSRFKMVAENTAP